MQVLTWLGIGLGSLNIKEEDPFTEEKKKQVEAGLFKEIIVRGTISSCFSGLSFRNVTSLLIGSSELTDMTPIRQIGPQLREFGISSSKVDEVALGVFLHSCKKLTKLSISRVEITIGLLREIASASFAKKLKELDLSRIQGDRGTEFIAICVSAGKKDLMLAFAHSDGLLKPQRYLEAVELYQLPDPLLVEGAIDLLNQFEALECLTLDGRRECTSEFVAKLRLKKLKTLIVIGTGTTYPCTLPGVRVIRFLKDF